MGAILLMFQVRSKLVQPLVLKHETNGVVFVVSFTIPVVALELPAVKHFSVENISTILGIFLRFELDFNDSLRMGLVESYSLDFSDLLYLLLDLLFESLDLGVILGNLWGEYVFYDDDFETLSGFLILFVLN